MVMKHVAAVTAVAVLAAPTAQAVPIVGGQGLSPNARAIADYVAANYPGVQSIGGVRQDPLPDHAHPPHPTAQEVKPRAAAGGLMSRCWAVRPVRWPRPGGSTSRLSVGGSRSSGLPPHLLSRTRTATPASPQLSASGLWAGRRVGSPTPLSGSPVTTSCASSGTGCARSKPSPRCGSCWVSPPEHTHTHRGVLT